ncbi:hypothetical protein [Arthrobacter bambusae]|uniref:hypothetical protein n=1 Tax=Arthrobacter bambusae TaxID=1338426 RepID=UPI00277E53FC|nr:hypothetical protein [Arthrobacter bambusae]MDQ0241264.1 hypothetical protein [Arthrobacter bambusae]
MRRKEGNDDNQPVEQLKVIHDEINRARVAATARIAGFHTRAALLVSASGIFTALQATKHVNCLSVLGTVLFLSSAALGLSALWPKEGDEIDPASALDHWLLETPQRARESIVRGNAAVLASDMKLAERLSTRLKIGYLGLIVAWAASYGSAFLPT